MGMVSAAANSPDQGCVVQPTATTVSALDTGTSALLGEKWFYRNL